MQRILAFVRSKAAHIRQILLEDVSSRDLIFVLFNAILSFVAAFMTIVNLFTAKWMLMISTLTFCLMCIFNIILSYWDQDKKMLARHLFLGEGILLCTFFCISGTPEGFSALWTCFIPSFGLALLGIRKGSVFSALGFLMISLLFWTPMGRSLLRYNYTESFMLRFPMIYLAFYLMALLSEWLRAETHRQLIEAERRYQHLYKHDALTGIYNRYGFNERFNQLYEDPQIDALAFMIIDLDRFKNVNDRYGHPGGDQVLRFAADTIQQMSGEQAVVSRWGGEEFTILMWNNADPMALVERIRQKFAGTPVHLDSGEDVRITVSIGVSIAAHHRDVTIAQMVTSADKCLYQAKEAGRNRISSIRL